MQSPEAAVPEDEGIAASHLGLLNFSDADVMVAREVGLHEVALEPGGAPVKQGDSVATEAMGKRAPVGIDRRRAARESVGDEFLRLR